MILLDSLHINNSGGKILLDYLVESLEKNKVLTFYMFDARCIGDYKEIPDDRKVFLKATLLNRHRFYMRKKKQFSRVLCFGNLGPTIALDIPVYTYFHQLLFLETPQSMTVVEKIKFKVKYMVSEALKLNTNIWLVQSEQVKVRLAKKYKLNNAAIKLMPFYPPLPHKQIAYERRKDGFVYVSSGSLHKNHYNLIAAFCNFFDASGLGILHLTVSDQFPDLKIFINSKVELGYPIINHGFISRNDLVSIYQKNCYLIYPSLSESFGLGIVEAIENGCKVIGANLPYTYAVCRPSLVFNPWDIHDIQKAFIESQREDVPPTKQLVFNQIDQIIKLLTE